jgi:hypothetical protein
MELYKEKWMEAQEALESQEALQRQV